MSWAAWRGMRGLRSPVLMSWAALRGMRGSRSLRKKFAKILPFVRTNSAVAGVPYRVVRHPDRGHLCKVSTRDFNKGTLPASCLRCSV
mgnify:CR=1 FL=1